MSRRHGTASNYNAGCRCADCTEAQRLRIALFRLDRAGSLSPDDPRHGNASSYINYGCRCRPCTDAHNARLLPGRARRIREGIPPDDSRHGTRYGYNEYGCRCEPCRTASRDYTRARRMAREVRPI